MKGYGKSRSIVYRLGFNIRYFYIYQVISILSVRMNVGLPESGRNRTRIGCFWYTSVSCGIELPRLPCRVFQCL